MQKVNWDSVQANEGGEFARPAPGGYIARIESIHDDEARQFLRIGWDFTDEPWAGSNRETYDRAGFWPVALIRSYKVKALPFFKAFKDQLEATNPGYRFSEDRLQDMIGRLIGVVLGEEEYITNAGELKIRLYVYQTKTVEAIRAGDFKIPALKPVQASRRPQSTAPRQSNSGFTGGGGFMEVSDEDGDLPF